MTVHGIAVERAAVRDLERPSRSGGRAGADLFRVRRGAGVFKRRGHTMMAGIFSVPGRLPRSARRPRDEVGRTP